MCYKTKYSVIENPPLFAQFIEPEFQKCVNIGLIVYIFISITKLFCMFYLIWAVMEFVQGIKLKGITHLYLDIWKGKKDVLLVRYLSTGMKRQSVHAVTTS